MQVSHSSVKVGGFVSATPLPPTIRRRDLVALVSVEHILSRLNPEGTLAMGGFAALPVSLRGLWVTAGLPRPGPQGESQEQHPHSPGEGSNPVIHPKGPAWKVLSHFLCELFCKNVMCYSINAAYKRFVLAASLSSGLMQSFPRKFKALQASPSCQGPMLLSRRRACSPVCQEPQIVSSRVALLSHNESSSLSLRIWKPGFSSSSLVMSLDPHTRLRPQFFAAFLNVAAFQIHISPLVSGQVSFLPGPGQSHGLGSHSPLTPCTLQRGDRVP